MPRKGLAPGQRRRDRDAAATLRRVAATRSQLATATASARTPHEELVAVIAALRSASAPGAHQIRQSRVDQIVAGVVEQARDAVDDLHARQGRLAEKTLATSPQNTGESHDEATGDRGTSP